VTIGAPDTSIHNVSSPNIPQRPRQQSRKQRDAYIVGGVDGGEGAVEAAHLLAANIGLAEVPAEQVVVAILNLGRSVVV
jgi:hypothetical protein